YKLYANRDLNNQKLTDENMVLPLASTIKNAIPQIEKAVVATHRNPRILKYGDNKIKKEGYTVNEDFFSMFSWKFIKGDPLTAIKDPSSIVLSSSTAKAFFGNDD